MTKDLQLLTLILSFLAVLVTSQSVHASTDYNHADLASVPVLHEGRVKPMDSFARIYLKRFADRAHLEDGTPALNWLVEALLDPRAASEQRIFFLRDQAVKKKMGFEAYDRDLFSYVELQEGLRKTAEDVAKLQDKEEDDITPAAANLIKLHYDILAYAQILRSFSLLLPLNVEVPEKYGVKPDENGFVTYYDLVKILPTVHDDLQKIIARKGSNVERYSKREQKITRLARELDLLQQGAANNILLRILPVRHGYEAGYWKSPWAAIQMGAADPKAIEYLKLWGAAIKAYHIQDEQAWEAALSSLQNFTLGFSDQRVSFLKMDVERFYMVTNPLLLGLILYVAAFVYFAAQGRWPKLPSRPLHIFVILALAFHLVELGCRIFILGRPPVATLYESVIFVSIVCAALCYAFYLRSHKSENLIIGLLCAISLILIAPYFVSDESNNLETLQAVLNTNFWLATHVIVITAGYGTCLIAACLAHYRLYRSGFTKVTKKALKSMDGSIHAAVILSLLLVAVGTILGGIWADQSWGRFWGWDPKENGALLIVLWIVWLLHGLHDHKFTKSVYAALVCMLNVIVALSWFGVNLLGVGLHSYGFTSGIFTYLMVFCAVQTLIALLLWRKNAPQKK